jgi:hypothetical protein
LGPRGLGAFRALMKHSALDLARLQHSSCEIRPSSFLLEITAEDIYQQCDMRSFSVRQILPCFSLPCRMRRTSLFGNKNGFLTLLQIFKFCLSERSEDYRLATAPISIRKLDQSKPSFPACLLIRRHALYHTSPLSFSPF